VEDTPWASLGAEAFRLLYSSLTYGSGQGQRVLLVTSVAPQEGKTLVAANLAVTFAREGARVLLVDCDFRRPRLHKMFHIERSPGLMDALRLASMPMSANPADPAVSDEESNLSDEESSQFIGSYSMFPGVRRPVVDGGTGPSGEPSQNSIVPATNGRSAAEIGLTHKNPRVPGIRETSVKGLSILPSGTALGKSAETLKAGTFRSLLRDLSGEFDVVILDTPPALVSADAVLLAPLADDVLMVIRAGQTHREAAERVHQQLADAGARVVGAVLNDPEGKVMRDRKLYYAYSYPLVLD